MKQKSKTQESGAVAQRRDAAIFKALNTPPKQHKDMKIGKRKKRQDERPTASSQKQT